MLLLGAQVDVLRCGTRAGNIEPTYRLLGNTDTAGVPANVTSVEVLSQPNITTSGTIYGTTVGTIQFPQVPAVGGYSYLAPGGATYPYGINQFAYITNSTASYHPIAVSPAIINDTYINVEYQYYSEAVQQNVTFVTEVPLSVVANFCP